MVWSWFLELKHMSRGDADPATPVKLTSSLMVPPSKHTLKIKHNANHTKHDVRCVLQISKFCTVAFTFTASINRSNKIEEVKD